VVHRDLKPANIFLARTPMGETPKILDFGISRIGDDNSSLTGTGDIVGTTYYLAPEQASGKPIDARADQYALGVILYECLTGARPFTGDAVYIIMRNIVEGLFRPPSQLCPDIPRELEAVIMRAMSRAPDDRFARVRDLGLALVPFMSVQGRQKWAHHFTAPEAEMPVAHSLALPGAAGPTPITPALPPAPTKMIPAPGQDMPTRTLQPADQDVFEATSDVLAKRPGRRGVLVLAAIAIAGLGLTAAWIVSRSSSTGTAIGEAAKSIPTAVPAPAPEPTPEPLPPPIPSAEPADEAGRDLRKKAGRPKEAAEPAEKAEAKSKRPTENDPKALKTGMW
jgi:eukaryotic-like serine/threonine-protein kinase